ncbi:MAG: hypothetical protein BWY82_01199 [Verrucomicrobia bacterium ADurb.Bin474]|nr:MAG: hypothetical protein BWY82_01199 [Verrucomicrobia bacterium ADurb.Bin474]
MNDLASSRFPTAPDTASEIRILHIPADNPQPIKQEQFRTSDKPVTFFILRETDTCDPNDYA